jgi:hypothetical protein
MQSAHPSDPGYSISILDVRLVPFFDIRRSSDFVGRAALYHKSRLHGCPKRAEKRPYCAAAAIIFGEPIVGANLGELAGGAIGWTVGLAIDVPGLGALAGAAVGEPLGFLADAGYGLYQFDELEEQYRCWSP